MKKKKILLFLVIVLLTICTLGLLPNNYVKAYDLGDVNLLICNPGEDASTEMNFCFHTSVSGVVVEIAKKSDGNFDNAIKVSATYTPYSEEYDFIGKTEYNVYYDESGTPVGQGYDTSKIYICEAYATGLEPATEYMYRVGAKNYSETRYFKTASNDGTFSFAVMSDAQIFGSGAFSTVNNTMNRAIKKAQGMGMDLDLVVSCGDDSNDSDIWQWRMLYDLDIYKQMPLATVPGNHDILNDPITEIFDSVNNNPKNGPYSDQESSYYFKWNNVLFIALNSQVRNSYGDYAGGSDAYIKQAEWMKNLLENETYQYVVAYTHFPCWGSGNGANVIKYWDPIFREYNVDLFFSGDNHDYGRGSTNVAAERGQAAFPNNYICVDDPRNAANGDKVNLGGYCIVKVTPEKLFYYAYDQNDELLDYCVYKARRNLTVSTDFSKETFEENITAQVVEEDLTKGTVSWQGDFIGHVRRITVTSEDGKQIDSVYTNDLNKNFVEITGLTADKEYTYNVKIEYKDDTTSTKTVSFETKVDYGKYQEVKLKAASKGYNLMLKLGNLRVDLLSKVKVYVDGEYKAEYDPKKQYFSLDASMVSLESKIELKGVVKSNNSEVLIGSYNGGKADPVLTVETNDFELEVGSEKEVKASVDTGKVVYTSSDTTIITIDDNGKVKALKVGNAKVIVSVEGTEIKKEIKVVVKEKKVEEPTKLDKPTIKVEGTTLTINSVSGATSYEIYIDGTLKETVTALTKDLSEYDLGEGSYKVTVKAKGENIEASELSAEATFTVKGNEPVVEPKPSSGCNSGSIQAVWYVLSILGLAVVLKKKRF